MPRMKSRTAADDRAPLGDWLLAIAAAGIVSCGHLVDGAGRTDLALLLVSFEGALLILFLAASAAARERLARPLTLILPALLFVAVISAGALSLWPGAPFDPKPVWRLVDLPPRPAVDRGAVVFELVKLGGLAAVFLAGFVAAGSRTLALRVLRALGLTTGLYAAYAFIEFASDPLLNGDRLMAGFGSANSAATLFGVSVLLSIAMIWSSAVASGGWRRNPDILAWLALLFSVAALLLTGSRAGVAATVTACVLLGLLELVLRRGRLSRNGAIGGLVVVVVIAALAAYSTRALLPRLDAIEHDREIRVTMVTAHWEAFREAPLLGHGMGSFRSINAAVTTPENIKVLFDIGAAHNVYVEWLEEAGLLGAVPMFTLVGVVLISILWSGLRSEAQTGLWQRTIACSLILALIHGWTDFAFEVPSFTAVLTLALGVAFGLIGVRARSRRRRSRDEHQPEPAY